MKFLLRVTLACLLLRPAAFAAPTLQVETPIGVEQFSASLVSPQGQTVWSCDVRATDSQSRVPECPSSTDWFQGPGKYVLVEYDKPQEQGGHTRSFAFEAFDEDEAIRLSRQWGRPRVDIQRVAPEGVRLSLTPPALVQAKLHNDSALPLCRNDSAAGRSLLLERKTDTGWQELPPPNADFAPWHEPVATGEAWPFLVPASIYEGLAPGVYRLVVLVNMEQLPPAASPGAPRSMSYSVRSEPFEWTGVLPLQSCLVEPAPAPLGWSPPPLRRLVPTSRGLLLWKGSGDLVDLTDGTRVVIGSLPENAFLPFGASRRYEMQDGKVLATDDGQTWAEVSRLDPKSTVHRFAVGDRLLEFSVDGSAMWIAQDGSKEKVDLPVQASWRAAAFENGNHGVLVGECAVVLETSDGGHTWRSFASPKVSPGSARWVNGELWIAGSGGVFRRRRGSDEFEQVISSSSCRVLSSSTTFGAACRGPDDAGDNAIYAERNGRGLDRLPYVPDAGVERFQQIEVDRDGVIWGLGTSSSLRRWKDWAQDGVIPFARENAPRR